MVQKLEAVKGGGGSVKVGATGTISSLMAKELDSIKAAPQTPLSSRHKPQTVPVSVACGSATPKRLQLRKSLDGTSGSAAAKRPQLRKSLDGASTSGGSGNSMSNKSPQTAQKTKSFRKNTHQIPMLGSDNIAIDRTPSRQKSDRKVSNIVEVVDVKCGNPERPWASPITNRFKKLGFSKLSDSII